MPRITLQKTPFGLCYKCTFALSTYIPPSTALLTWQCYCFQKVKIYESDHLIHVFISSTPLLPTTLKHYDTTHHHPKSLRFLRLAPRHQPRLHLFRQLTSAHTTQKILGPYLRRRHSRANGCMREDTTPARWRCAWDPRESFDPGRRR
jgi:hypothetical protein